MVVPSKFREHVALGSKVYLLSGFDGCISIYPQAQFDTYMAKITSLNYHKSNDRAFTRAILASIVDLEIDSHGRISLPKAILTKYKINPSVTVVGVNDHFEIWNSKAFEDYENAANADLASLADQLEDKQNV